MVSLKFSTFIKKLYSLFYLLFFLYSKIIYYNTVAKKIKLCLENKRLTYNHKYNCKIQFNCT